MAGVDKYDWPDTEVLVKLVEEYGQVGAAKRLGIPRPTLQSRLNKMGVAPAKRRRRPDIDLNERALEEVSRLVNS